MRLNHDGGAHAKAPICLTFAILRAREGPSAALVAARTPLLRRLRAQAHGQERHGPSPMIRTRARPPSLLLTNLRDRVAQVKAGVTVPASVDG